MGDIKNNNSSEIQTGVEKKISVSEDENSMSSQYQKKLQEAIKVLRLGDNYTDTNRKKSQQITEVNHHKTLEQIEQHYKRNQQTENRSQESEFSLDNDIEDSCFLELGLKESIESVMTFKNLESSYKIKNKSVSSSDEDEVEELQDFDSESVDMTVNNMENNSNLESSIIFTSTCLSNNQSKDLSSESTPSDISIKNCSISDSDFSSTFSSQSSIFSSSPVSEPSILDSDTNPNLNIFTSKYSTSSLNYSNIDLPLPSPFESIQSSIISLSPEPLPELPTISEKELFTAARENNQQLVRILLDAGIDVNSRDEQQHTPIHCAACRDHSEIISLLLDSGAIVNVKDNAGNTPLHYAAANYLSRSVKQLINAGADVNLRNNKGESPLHVAVKSNNNEVVRTLLEEGARKTIEDNFGRTPLDLAQEDIFGIDYDIETKALICQILAL